jgi:hypothetical protein
MGRQGVLARHRRATMITPRRTARVVFAAGCAVLLATACSRRGNDYPPEVVANFLRACRSRASEGSCRCSLEKIQQRYTADEYRALEGSVAATRQAPKELLDIIAACR